MISSVSIVSFKSESLDLTTSSESLDLTTALASSDNFGGPEGNEAVSSFSGGLVSASAFGWDSVSC